MTSWPTLEPRRPIRRWPLIAGVTLLLACLGIWLFAPAVIAGPSTTVRWQLAPFGQPVDRMTSVIPVYLDQWPIESCSQDGDWLASPLVVETPWSVTITMHSSSSFDGGACQGWYDFWGTPVDVRLSAPLGGRALFDGSTIPPTPR